MVTVCLAVLQCVLLGVWITYGELDNLVKHDVRRDVEVKDKILQRVEGKKRLAIKMYSLILLDNTFTLQT